MEFIAKSLKDTQDFGKTLGSISQPGDLILLNGVIGSGKTTLVQSFAHGLGVKSNEYISSPSFTLINEYQGKYPIFHIDLYRINSPSELEELGLEEIISCKNSVTLIEWAEKLILPNTQTFLFKIEYRLEIYIKIREEERIFEIQPIQMDNRFSLIFPLH